MISAFLNDRVKGLAIIVIAPVLFCIGLFAIILAIGFLQLTFPFLIAAAIFYYLYSLTPLAQRLANAKAEKRKQKDLIERFHRRIEESPYTEEAFSYKTEDGVCLDGRRWKYDEEKAERIRREKLSKELFDRKLWEIDAKRIIEEKRKNELEKRIAWVKNREFFRSHGFMPDEFKTPEELEDSD